MIDLELALQELHRAGVEFVIAGGTAATIHGSARVTQDLDHRVCAHPEKIGKARALRRSPPPVACVGAPGVVPFRWDAETIRRGLNFTLTTTLGDVDLLRRNHRRWQLRRPAPS